MFFYSRFFYFPESGCSANAPGPLVEYRYCKCRDRRYRAPSCHDMGATLEGREKECCKDENRVMRKVPMTIGGAERLRAELNELKTVRRPSIIQSIAEAREHGDLRENAEYHAAREQQSFCEGRIREIEGKLADSEVIDVTTIPVTGKVMFGATVTLINLESEQTVRYQIVGEDEADVKAGKISVASPIARAVMGKEEGDEVVVRAPSGDIEYEIDTVEHI